MRLVMIRERSNQFCFGTAIHGGLQRQLAGLASLWRFTHNTVGSAPPCIRHVQHSPRHTATHSLQVSHTANVHPGQLHAQPNQHHPCCGA